MAAVLATALVLFGLVSANAQPLPPPSTPASVGPEAPPTLRVERVEIRGVSPERVPGALARVGITPGDPVDDHAVDAARLALLSTGYHQSVEARLERGQRRGLVVLVFECTPRSTLSLDAVHLGVARPTGLWGGLDVSDLDPFGAGVGAEIGVVGSEAQQAGVVGASWSAGADRLRLRGRLLRGDEPLVGPRGQLQRGEPVEHVSLPYRRMGVELQWARPLGRIHHLHLGLRVESVEASPPARAEQIDPDDRVVPFEFQVGDGASALAVLTAGLEHDGRDDPLYPRRGARVAAEISGGVAWSAPWGLAMVRAEQLLPGPGRHVVRLDALLGGLLGDAPFFERFFIGDLHPYLPARALGLNMARRRGPHLIEGALAEQRYETLVGRAGVEYRIPLGRGLGNERYGAELFVGAAGLALGSPDTPRGERGRAGLPVDVALDAGLRVETELGVLGLSVGTLFQLIDP